MTTIWRYVLKTETCWLWTGARSKCRSAYYGSYRSRRAHRAVYEMVNGAIPTGLTLDHLCRNTLCVNPEHLEAVTNRENILRGTGPSALAAQATHCPKGHEYSPENTRIRPRGFRQCKACHRESTRVANSKYRAKLRALRRALTPATGGE